MTAAAEDWLRIADRDIDAVGRLLVPAPQPNSAVAAYHCQQATEKLVKALLAHFGIAFPRGSGGHDLRRLADLLPATLPLRQQALGLAPLSPWATAFRYPAEDPFAAEAEPDEQMLRTTLDAIMAFRVGVAAIVAPATW